RTLFVPRGAAIIGAQGRIRSATRSTRFAPSRNSASMAKRMNSMVIDPVLVRRSPSSSPRRERGMRPRPRVSRLSATAQRVARTVPRVRSRTVSELLAVLERAAGLHRGERGGREDHDEERGENAADRRQHDEDRGTRGLLLRALAPLGTERLGLDPEDLGHRHTELVGLDDRGDEALELLHVDAVVDPPQRFLPGFAHPLLGGGSLALVAERSLQLLRDLPYRGIETEPCLQRMGDKLDRVRKVNQGRGPPPVRAPALGRADDRRETTRTRGTRRRRP